MSYRYATDVLPEEEDLDENFVLRHWRGHLSLAKSWFLVGGALSAILVIILSAALGYYTGTADSLQAVAAATLIFFLVFVALRTWAIVGIWRSAGRHVARGGSKSWAVVARILLAVGLLGTLVQARNYWVMTAEYGKMAMGDDALGKPAKMSVVDDGRALLVEGNLASGTWQAFRDLLGRSGKVEVIQLNSLGGRIFEADKIATLIRAKGLDTQVVNDCVSACTIVLLAGRNRMAGRFANVGFHQPDFPGMQGAMRAAMIADNSRIYREAGIAQPFIDRMMATPPAEVWYPEYEELLSSGVVNSDEAIVIGPKGVADPVTDALAREAAATKPQLPLTVDDMTQLVEVGSVGRTMTLGYRINRPIAANPALKASMTKSVTEGMCASPMRRLVDGGATIKMAYSDNRGRSLFSVDIVRCA